MRKLSQPNVLTYDPGGRVSRGKVKRHYLAWRSEHGVPERCDMPGCPLNTEPPTWKAAPIRLILDHVDGNAKNHHPDNLRLVCPNCGAQLETHGGANAGRVQNAKADGYAIVHRDGRRDATAFLRGTEASTAVGSVSPSLQLTLETDPQDEKESRPSSA
jgi:hypothetical protein